MRLFVSVSALFFIIFFLPYFSAGKELYSLRLNTQYQINSEKYHFVIFQNDTGGWFYVVNKGRKRFIVQKNIPVVQGNKAFSDSIQAKRVAHLVVAKLNKGLFPPSVQKSDLDSLKIIY